MPVFLVFAACAFASGFALRLVDPIILPVATHFAITPQVAALLNTAYALPYALAQPDWLGGTVVKKPSRKLEPGMVVTIEPGLYVRPGEGVPERFWNIGIRIEDDVVVTAGGCEIISRGVPVSAAEIEALMRS